MLKVECDSCKAPYQIDEKRIPPAGLKMRCPKCGHSFLVGGGAEPADPNATAMVPSPFASPPAAGAAAPAPTKPPPPPASSRKATMVGLAPVPVAGAGRGPQAATPPVGIAAKTKDLADLPAALGSFDESDLPVVGAPARRASTVPMEPPRVSEPPARAPAPTAPLQPPPARAPAAATKKGGFGDIDLDIPLEPPSSRKPVPAPAPPPDALEFDLPAPVAPGGREIVGLPAVSAGLPAPAAGLPVVSAGLPAPAAGLPAVAAGLPTPAGALPELASGLPAPVPPDLAAAKGTGGFGDVDLPSLAMPPSAPAKGKEPPPPPPPLTLQRTALAEPAPPPAPPPPPAPAPAAHATAPGGFGDIDLGPAPAPAPPAQQAPQSGGGGFGDLDFGEDFAPPPNAGAAAAAPSPAAPPPPRAAPPRAPSARAPVTGGGMGFGEVDLGGEADGGGGGGAIGIDAHDASPASAAPTSLDAMTQVASSVQEEARAFDAEEARQAPETVRRRRRRTNPIVVIAVVAALLVTGGGLELTPYGAFGRWVAYDLMHAKQYVAALSSTMASIEKTLGSDTYDDAKAALEASAAAHARMRRDKPLTAYAAVVDFATSVRFGTDPSRASRGKELLIEIGPDKTAKYRDVALAAQAADLGDLTKARAELDAVARRYARDPIAVEIALIRGNLELAAKDAPAAAAAFKSALAQAPDARAHFGLARAYAAMGDEANAKKEIAATLAVSPLNPGALTMRARLARGTRLDDTQAFKDVDTIVDGRARAKASPVELSTAYATKAWLLLDRGEAGEAHEAFDQAVKLDPRDVAALDGEGRLLLAEGRNTEALARFDTALQYDPASPETIADDAEAKISLERLADAKQQLLDAQKKFPKDMGVMLLIGKVDQRLGDADAADKVLHSALTLADPARPDAVLPYVALAELMVTRGHDSDAKALLEEATKKLPPSAALDRALGELAQQQGDFDQAIALYRSAIAKDGRDARSHFDLATALRRSRQFDEASTELDKVAAIDKEYPQLAEERGMLFEDSGEVAKALEQFKAALEKAKDDPDLQLRIGALYVAIERPDDAIPMLKKVLEKRPMSAEAHHVYGRALLLEGGAERGNAEHELKRAVALDPTRAEYHVYVAWAANEAEPAELDLARDEIDQALSIDKTLPEAYWQRGVLERMQGADDDAIRDELRALKLKPSRYQAHATLAECYGDKNDPATAMAEWEKAIAGDANRTNADGTVPHPFWRYEYAKMLTDRGDVGRALPLLQAAVTTGQKLVPRPAWVVEGHFLLAEALRKNGRNADACEHYKRFFEYASVNSPDLADAQRGKQQVCPQQ